MGLLHDTLRCGPLRHGFRRFRPSLDLNVCGVVKPIVTLALPFTMLVGSLTFFTQSTGARTEQSFKLLRTFQQCVAVPDGSIPSSSCMFGIFDFFVEEGEPAAAYPFNQSISFVLQKVFIHKQYGIVYEVRPTVRKRSSSGVKR